MDQENNLPDKDNQRGKQDADRVEKPFDLDEALRDENIKASEEDAAAEQQRKEAMTERD
jgi:hypothetical protein